MAKRNQTASGPEEISLVFKHPRNSNDPYEARFNPADAGTRGTDLLDAMSKDDWLHTDPERQSVVFTNERTGGTLDLDRPLGEQDVQDGDTIRIDLSSAIAQEA